MLANLQLCITIHFIEKDRPLVAEEISLLLIINSKTTFYTQTLKSKMSIHFVMQVII